MNFLEQLAAEWFEYSGYFVRTNVKARKRAAGGWDMELDVLAYQPSNQSLLHIETSGDADSWVERKKRFLEKKFVLDRTEYEEMLGSPIKEVRRLAIVSWAATTKADLDWGEGVEVLTIPTFLAQITNILKDRDFMSEAVPEGYPILRTIQMTLQYGVAAKPAAGAD
jgi:hypothetical protein